MRWLLLIIALSAAGCGNWTDERTPTRERQDAALRDPFSYSPYDDGKKQDISGGGMMDYNKDAMKRDVNSVLNP